MRQGSKELKIQGIIIFLVSITVISSCQLGQLPISALTPTATSTITPAPTAIGGGLIAFVKPADFNICFIRVDGANLNCLDIKGNEPDWSPDGNRLIFHSIRDENSGLYVTNADGTNIIRLTYNSDVELDRHPNWSPDGKHIVFTSIDGFIYVMNTDGTNTTRLTGVLCNFPAWSPDGKRIAVSGTNAFFINDSSSCNISGIYLMDADGSNKTLLTKLASGNVRDIAWSPDGKHIAFTSNLDAPPTADSFYYDIYLMNSDGTNIIRLTQDGQGGYDLTWSPDGRHIAFSNYNREENKMLIYIMNVDGLNIIKLTEGLSPAWQP